MYGWGWDLGFWFVFLYMDGWMRMRMIIEKHEYTCCWANLYAREFLVSGLVCMYVCKVE